MSLRWPDDPRWTALLGPVSAALTQAVARLEVAPEPLPPVVAGTPGVLVQAWTGALALDPALLDARHPLDVAWLERTPPELHALALDRWRRAAGAVLEGLVSLSLDTPPGAPAWWGAARAAEAADRAAPELGLLWPALVDWLLHPELGIGEDAHRGAWFARWRRLAAAPGWSAPAPEDWLAFGTWLHERATVDAPLPLSAAARPPGAWTAAPWSFRRVHVEGGPAGAHVVATGSAFAPTPRLPCGEHATVLAATLTGGPATVSVTPAGPVGTWQLRAGRTESRVGAARGMDLTLHADGTADVTLADAFIGPTTEDALDLASRFGVSGLLLGTWRAVGFDGDATVIELGPVRTEAITVHPRGRRGFAMPAGPMLGAAEGWLKRAAGTRWRVHPTAEGLEATGADLGPKVTLVFGRG